MLFKASHVQTSTYNVVAVKFGDDMNLHPTEIGVSSAGERIRPMLPYVWFIALHELFRRI